MSEDGAAFTAGLATGLIILVFTVFFMHDCKNDSHIALGSKGHACFPNMTCRENLKCLQADGLSTPTCVSK